VSWLSSARQTPWYKSTLTKSMLLCIIDESSQTTSDTTTPEAHSSSVASVPSLEAYEAHFDDPDEYEIDEHFLAVLRLQLIKSIDQRDENSLNAAVRQTKALFDRGGRPAQSLAQSHSGTTPTWPWHNWGLGVENSNLATTPSAPSTAANINSVVCPSSSSSTSMLVSRECSCTLSKFSL